MSNSEAAFEALKSSIRPYLKDYLNKEGIKISPNGMMQCLNPAHLDKNASMKLLSDLRDEQVWCYGCQTTGDIFTVNHWIKKAPIHGVEFIKDNVFELAKEFSIPHDDIQLSSEQIERLEQIRFNSLVVERLTLKDDRNEPINWTHEHCNARGWPSSVCEKLKIATVLDYNKLIRDLQRMTGMTVDEIKAKGVTSELFGPEYITIPLYDPRGRPIGFTARYMKWTKESSVPKYRNSSHSSAFQKGSTLYGLHLIRNAGRKRLDIFEGNGSFITAYGAGHNSCVALCGSSLTDEQIKLIVDMGYSNINLVLDQDDTGKKKTDEYMQRLSGIEGLKVHCTALTFKPEDSHLKDPEDFIQKYGLAEFYKLKPVGGFDWYLMQEAEAVKNGQIDPADFAKKMVKVIYNTENRIDRARQRAKLAEITGIPERDLEMEMERQVKISVNDIKTSIAKKLSTATSIDDIVDAVESFKGSMSDTLDYKETAKLLSIEESVQSFDEFMTTLENKKPGIQGWTCAYPLVDVRLSGIPKPVGFDDDGNKIPIPGSLFGFAGAPQHGKSTIMQNFALNIALKNPDAITLYWCLDDSRQRVTERLLAMHSGISWKKITRREPISGDEIDRLKESVIVLRDLMESGRLLLKDRSNGSTMQFLTKWIETTKERTDQPILIGIDSFHKIGVGDADANLNEYAKAKKICSKLKDYAQTYCISVLSSLELSKGQARGVEPELLNIMDARKIEYDFDIIATVYNHYYDTDGESDQIITTDSGKIKPLIKFNIRKSKDGGSGPVYFALNQDNFRITDYSLDDIKRLTNTNVIKSVSMGGLRITPPDVNGLAKPKPTLAELQLQPQAASDEPWNDE